MIVISSTDPRGVLREGRIDDAILMVIPRACVSYKNSIMNNVFYRTLFVFTTISQYEKRAENITCLYIQETSKIKVIYS